MASPRLLRWLGRFAAKTQPSQVGDLTISMLRGELGNQARELDELIHWLKDHFAPDIVCLSNALLLGMARSLKQKTGAPLVCTLQGEDGFVDALPQPQRQSVWSLLRERAVDVDLFLAPSRFYGELMQSRLHVPADRMRVLHNGIQLEGFTASERPAEPPVLGFFCRMCKEKGLHLVVEAFLTLKQRPNTRHLKLRVGGGLGRADEPFVEQLRQRLAQHGFPQDAEFCPNLDRRRKQEFYRSLSVFSVPAIYGEAFGLYLLEAMASGVPVVQPRHGAFPEILEATDGGILFEAGQPQALANALEPLFLNPARARALGEAGRRKVFEQFSVEHMARRLIPLYRNLLTRE